MNKKELFKLVIAGAIGGALASLVKVYDPQFQLQYLKDQYEESKHPQAHLVLADFPPDISDIQAQAEIWLIDNGMKVAPGYQLVAVEVSAVENHDLVQYADESGKLSWAFVVEGATEGGKVAIDIGDSETMLIIGVDKTQIKAAFRAVEIKPAI